MTEGLELRLPSRRKFLLISTIAVGGIVVAPYEAQLSKAKIYQVYFQMPNKFDSDFWQRYVWTDNGYNDNVDVDPLGIRVRGSAPDITAHFNKMIIERDIPDTSVLDKRLEAIAHEMMNNSDYVNANFKFNGAERQSRFFRYLILNSQHKTQDAYLGLGLGAIPVEGGLKLVEVEWYNATELDEHNLVINHHYQRSGTRNSEMWGVDDKIVTLRPQNAGDLTTISELDVRGLRRKLNEGIKKQGLITNANQIL